MSVAALLREISSRCASRTSRRGASAGAARRSVTIRAGSRELGAGRIRVPGTGSRLTPPALSVFLQQHPTQQHGADGHGAVGNVERPEANAPDADVEEV